MFKSSHSLSNYLSRVFFLLKNSRTNKILIKNPVKILWKKISFTSCHELMIGRYVICRGTLSLQKPFSKLFIGERSFIGHNTIIVSTECVEIRNDVLISHDCYIIDSDGHSSDASIRSHDIPNRWRGFKDWSVVTSKPILIDDNVWIGPKVIILKGVSIAEGAIVCAGSVVTKNVDPYSVVAGVPAKHLRYVN